MSSTVPAGNPAAISDPIPADHIAEIRRLGKRAVEDVIEIGRRLAECRDVVGHGNWLPWLDREFGWSEATARNFMRVHELAKTKSANFADLNLPISTLYLLAAPTVADEIRDEFLGRAANGEQVSQEDVKTAIAGKRKTPAKSVTPLVPPETSANTDEPEQGGNTNRIVLRDWKTGEEYVETDDHAHLPAETAAKSDDELIQEGEAAATEYVRATKGHQRALDDILANYFDSAAGSDIFSRIPEVRHAEVVAAFVDKLGVTRMLRLASGEFGRMLRAALPADPNAWLVEKDAGTIARKIIDTAGPTKAAAIRERLEKLGAPKKIELLRTTDASGNTIHALDPHGNCSRH